MAQDDALIVYSLAQEALHEVCPACSGAGGCHVLAGGLGRRPGIDTATIESITGLKGTYNQKENVFKVSKPRDDVKISVDRWTMPAFMGLTSWAGFTPTGKETMLRGDTVLDR